jgi:putative sterol carrier protein
MNDATDAFFENLSTRGPEPLLENTTATVRFDITSGKQVDRWYLRINKGDLEVSRDEADADAVLGADRAAFNRVATGEANVLAALLRAEVLVSGDPDLVVLVQRLFPGPPRVRGREPVAAEGGRSS